MLVCEILDGVTPFCFFVSVHTFEEPVTILGEQHKLAVIVVINTLNFIHVKASFRLL